MLIDAPFPLRHPLEPLRSDQSDAPGSWNFPARRGQRHSSPRTAAELAENQPSSKPGASPGNVRQARRITRTNCGVPISLSMHDDNCRRLCRAVATITAAPRHGPSTTRYDSAARSAGSMRPDGQAGEITMALTGTGPASIPICLSNRRT